MWVGASIPLERLEDYWEKIRKERFPIELVLKAEVLDSWDFADFRGWAKRLEEEGLLLTVHLPFMDLSLAALDPWIRKISLQRLELGLERASIFSPVLCVFHSGYHPDYHRELAETWRKIFMQESLPKILAIAKELGLKLALENTFEPSADFLLPVFQAFSQELGWCFDAGHARVFSIANEFFWLQTLKDYLWEIHCHDNLGKFDDHLPLGKGSINFPEIFAILKAWPQLPIFTIEVRSEEGFWQSFHYLKEYFA